jgi:hypothetical protein
MRVAAANQPPMISNVSVDKPTLRPPNHKMVAVTVNYAATDDSSPPTCTLRATSNEPVNGKGDGNTAPDWQVIDAHHVQLRAERSGKDNGRIYTITITCRDSTGLTATKPVTVIVPKGNQVQ